MQNTFTYVCILAIAIGCNRLPSNVRPSDSQSDSAEPNSATASAGKNACWRDSTLKLDIHFLEGFSTVWTGSKVILWGPTTETSKWNRGLVIDPKTSAFSPINSDYNNSTRKISRHSAVWTGEWSKTIRAAESSGLKKVNGLSWKYGLWKSEISF